MPIAQNLKYLLARFGVSNYRLAKLIGCSQTSVANWLSGETEPYKKTQEVIADLFGITVEELQGDSLPPIRLGSAVERRKASGGMLSAASLFPAGAAIAAIDTAGAALIGGKKKKPTPNESELDSELISRLCRLSPQELALVDVFVQGLLAKREVLASPDE